MNDPLPMQGRQGAQHRQRRLNGFTRRQRAAAKPPAQRLALEELHRQKQPVLVFVNLVQLTHIGMIDARRRARLPPETLVRLTVDQVVAYSLDGDRSIEALIMGGVHDTHAALSELTYDAIPTR